MQIPDTKTMYGIKTHTYTHVQSNTCTHVNSDTHVFKLNAVHAFIHTVRTINHKTILFMTSSALILTNVIASLCRNTPLGKMVADIGFKN